ncbi:zincin [Thozetella sp. PMI_491]|nr:zincin [Thozetella sp. PMI_491]
MTDYNVFDQAKAPPAVSGQITAENAPETFQQVHQWLEYFGYLAHGVPVTAEDVTNALRAAQSMGGIECTGEYDEATRRLLGQERCGNPDRTTPAAGPYGPPKFILNNVVRGRLELTYGLCDLSSHFSEKDCRSAIKSAMFYWAAIAPFTFTESTGTEPVDILFRWGKGLHHLNCPYDFSTNTNAHAMHPKSSTSQTDINDSGCNGQIHFADDRVKDMSLDRMTHVAVHEIGHALGLSHSYAFRAMMCSSANLDLGLDDIAGIQAIYPPLQPKLLGAGQELYQLLPNGNIYQRLKSPRYGWTIVDYNRRNHQIVNSGTAVYLHHVVDGQVYKFTGKALSWQCIHNHPDTKSIAASGISLYQLKNDSSGQIWKYSGKNDVWAKLDHSLLSSMQITDIIASGDDSKSRVFARSQSGHVLRILEVSGKPLDVVVVWNSTSTTDQAIEIAFGDKSLYVRLASGEIRQLLDVDVDPTRYEWRLVDLNPQNENVACAGGCLFFRRSDNTLHRYLGQSHPDASQTSPIVTLIDSNVPNLSVTSLANGEIFVVRSEGQIWHLIC